VKKNMPTAFITGVTGQDGSYLAELLLRKGYRVIGTAPSLGTVHLERIRHLLGKIELVAVDLQNQAVLKNTLETLGPDEIYNLASPSLLSDMILYPVQTGEICALAVTRLLEAILAINPRIRFFQASSSEMFGKVTEVPQSETTPFHPRNPYGVAKVYGHLIIAYYREYHSLYACSGILYNHESPRRNPQFVTRKITHGAASIKLGMTKELRIGNLDARRDWGYAGDYVEAMWLMLQQPNAANYIIATGETHSVREFCDLAFQHVGLDYRDFVVQDAELLRPTETGQLVGNPSKARSELGWKPTVTFKELVSMMVDSDLEIIRRKTGQRGNP
jgi:GDPmannose 4,6-dehydratase